MFSTSEVQHEKNTVRLYISGDYACFTRPGHRVERLSYPVMTPSAAMGVLAAVYAKPEMRWVVTQIHVLRPIRYTTMTVLESKDVRNIASTRRRSTILRDVAYVIVAHPEHLSGEGNARKHYEIFCRRAKTGNWFKTIGLGRKRYMVNEAYLVDDIPTSELVGREELGPIYHSGTLQQQDRTFFVATMVNGVIDVPVLE